MKTQTEEFNPYIRNTFIDHWGFFCLHLIINGIIYKMKIEGFKKIEGKVCTEMYPIMHYQFFEN